MKEGLDNFFEQFLDTKPIFHDKKVFQPNFMPLEFSHRDEQISQIANILAPCLRNDKPSNLFIYGKTGTGKTISVSYVAASLDKVAKQKNLPLSLISVNCKLRRVADTEYRLIAELCRHLDYEVPATGLPTNEIYASFVKALESKSMTVVLILDEIDHLVAKIGSDILYNLTRLNSQLSSTQLSIVGISNDLLFTEHLDPRVKSSLSEEELIFPPYNAVQLQAILSQRALLAFEKDALEMGVIEKCAAFAAREHGDARRAIELLRVAGELAERQGSPKVALSHIDAAQEKIEHDRIEDVVAAQPKQHQAVLLAILRLSVVHKGFFYTGDVYNIYDQLCDHCALRPLTQRRVADILAEFDMQGIISAPVISKGRQGRSREISVPLASDLSRRVVSILERSLDIAQSQSVEDSKSRSSNDDDDDSSSTPPNSAISPTPPNSAIPPSPGSSPAPVISQVDPVTTPPSIVQPPSQGDVR